MMGRRRARQARFEFTVVAPPDTSRRALLLQLNEVVDWSFLYDRAAPCFSNGTGRASIDPVVMMKMMLVGCLFGIESDRALVEHCADSLSVREFLGYDLDEALPVHASFTHWRQRLGPDYFRDALHEITRQCVAAGLSITSARAVDGTFVKAQASTNGPRLEVPQGEEIAGYLESYFAGEVESADRKEEPTTSVNLNDPEARFQQKRGHRADFGYQASFSSDIDSGLICDATATVRERAGTAVEHVDQDPFGVDELAADTLYDSSEALHHLIERGVVPYVPKRSARRRGYLSKERFTYDPERDVFACPAGCTLRFQKIRKQSRHYIASRTDCRSCVLKPQCTKAVARTVTRTLHESARERTVRAGPRYDYLQRRRHINEYLHSLGKRQHCLRRARGIGLASARIQACLVAMAINLNKLIAHVDSRASTDVLGALWPLWEKLYALTCRKRRPGRRNDVLPIGPGTRQSPQPTPTQSPVLERNGTPLTGLPVLPPWTASFQLA